VSSRHLVHGLVVDSPVPLAAGPTDPTDPDAHPDLRVHLRVATLPPMLGKVLAVSSTGQSAGGTTTLVRTSAGEVAIRLSDVLHAVTSGDELVVTVVPGASRERLGMLLSGPVLSALVTARGHLVLHGSAVSLGDGAVAFVGPTGAGKSTLAWLLARRGELLSDDALRVTVVGGHAVAHRGTTRTRLRKPLNSGLPGWMVLSVAPDGRLLPPAGRAAPGSAPLRLVVVPSLSPQHTELRAVVVPGAEAAVRLCSLLAVRGVADDRLRATSFRRCVSLASVVPVVHLEVPWDGRPSEELGEGLASLVAAYGVSGG
jgi:hypothetical protein